MTPSNISITIYDEDTDIYTSQSQTNGEKNDNIDDDVDDCDEAIYNSDCDAENTKREDNKAKERNKILKEYYESLDLPEFPEKMECMLKNDSDIWTNRTKRHSFIQFLANFYFNQTTISDQDKEKIGYIYQPVALKLLKKYENLNKMINAVCMDKNSEILTGVDSKRKRFYQSWVCLLLSNKIA